VIVLQININGILAVKTKCNTPISGHTDCISVLAIARQPVKPEAGDIHILGLCGSVQAVKQPFGSCLASRQNASVVIVPEKPLKASVLECPNHVFM
jgi:hypothetical protein